MKGFCLSPDISSENESQQQPTNLSNSLIRLEMNDMPIGIEYHQRIATRIEFV